MNNIKNIFITGITGYIGGTIAVKLRERGYNVTGLVRKAEVAKILQKQGFESTIGSLDDSHLLKENIAKVDAVIHAADSDNPAVAERFITLLKHTGKTFIYTSGSSIIANWEKPETASFIYNEDFPLPTDTSQGHRVEINRNILKAAIDGVRTVVIVPGMVYGNGLLLSKESKQLPLLIQTAKKQGTACYVGDGKHRWSNVHVEDLTDLYILAMEKAQPGTLFFAENGMASFKELASAVQAQFKLKGAPQSLSKTEAAELWGEMMATVALGSDCRMTAEKARKMLDWKPARASVLEWIKSL